MKNMKHYQFFIFIFLFFGVLHAADETPAFRLTEVIAANQQQGDPPAAESPEKNQEAEQVPSEETEPAESPITTTTESYESAFIKTIVVLIGLLALVVLTVWMFKKISHGRLRTFNYLKSIKIIEKRPLSPKSMLYLIEVNGKQVLIAESQLEVKPVMTIDSFEAAKDL